MTTSDEIDEIFREHLSESERKAAMDKYGDMPLGAMLLLAILTAIGSIMCAKIMELVRKITLKSVLLWTMAWASLNILFQAAAQYWIENNISEQIHAMVPAPTTATETVVEVQASFLMTMLFVTALVILAIKIIEVFTSERW